jgi:hypothetical protein
VMATGFHGIVGWMLGWLSTHQQERAGRIESVQAFRATVPAAVSLDPFEIVVAQAVVARIQAVQRA